MADAPVMDSPNGNTEAGGSAFDDLMFADSNRDGRVGDADVRAVEVGPGQLTRCGKDHHDSGVTERGRRRVTVVP